MMWSTKLFEFIDKQDKDIFKLTVCVASQITSPTTVYSTLYSGADQSKHQSSAPLAFVWGIHRWVVHSSHKGSVTRKMFLFDGAIMDVIDFLDTLNIKIRQ